MGLLIRHNLLGLARGLGMMVSQSPLMLSLVVYDCARFGRDSLRDTSPTLSGAMHDSWAVQPVSLLAANVVNPVYYTLFQFTGTRSHPIAPRNGPALLINGNFVFGEVQHPGTAPSDVMWSALEGSIEYARLRLAQFGPMFRVSFGSALVNAGVREIP